MKFTYCINSWNVGGHCIWQHRQKFADTLKFDSMELFDVILNTFDELTLVAVLKPSTKMPTFDPRQFFQLYSLPV